MADDNDTSKTESLGEFLVRHRDQKELAVEDILAETKIPPKVLKAIDEDDYESLPAEAFARGFYMLYAKAVGLDAQTVLDRYSELRGTPKNTRSPKPPHRQLKEVNTMAARPFVAHGSFIGFSLVLIIILIGALSVYFSWNPATYLSEKLRNLQEPETAAEMQQDDAAANEDALSSTAGSQAGSLYYLTVDFLEDTTATVAIDNGFPEKNMFTKGSTRSWQADEAITLIIPEVAKIKLLLNGKPIDLPKPVGGFITFNLP